MKIRVKGLLTLIAAGLFVQSALIYVGSDHTAPKIKFGDSLPVYKGDPEDKELLSNVTAKDGRDGDVTSSIYIDTIRVTSDGSHATITYVALDKHNNVAKASQQIECQMDTKKQEETTEPAATPEPTASAAPAKEPVLTLSTDQATIGVGDVFSIMNYVSSITDDKDDNNYLTTHVSVDGETETYVAGKYELTCYATDSEGNRSNEVKFTLTRQ